MSSVLVGNRKESKFEVIVYSLEIHKMLIEFMQRDFGVKSIDNFVRVRYAHGKDKAENYVGYRHLMTKFKERVDSTASLLTSNARTANSIYPTSLHEYEIRRDYQNFAIANCEQLIKELQQIADIFDVNLNAYEKYVKAIDREIELIKKWRQRDNKLKSSLKG